MSPGSSRTGTTHTAKESARADESRAERGKSVSLGIICEPTAAEILCERPEPPA